MSELQGEGAASSLDEKSSKGVIYYDLLYDRVESVAEFIGYLVNIVPTIVDLVEMTSNQEMMMPYEIEYMKYQRRQT